MAARSTQTKLIEFATSNSAIRPLWRVYRKLHVKQRSPFDNIYHCCTQKTASQWFRGIFADPVFADYTGLESVPFIDLGLRGTSIKTAFPVGSVVTHLYIDYPTYQAIPKPERFRVFFVMRDPRDAVVSWYFSARYSHALYDRHNFTRLALGRVQGNQDIHSHYRKGIVGEATAQDRWAANEPYSSSLSMMYLRPAVRSRPWRARRMAGIVDPAPVG
jgi:hypothetical protein